MKVKPRPYDERSAYARCYGNREGNVRVVKVEPKRPRYEAKVSGEKLRQGFEQRLAKREPASVEESATQDASAAGAAGSDEPSAVLG